MEISDALQSPADPDIDPKLLNAKVQRDKLRVDTRKWLMARMAPRKYGDRLFTAFEDKDGKPADPPKLGDRELARRLAYVLASGAAKTVNPLPVVVEHDAVEDETPGK